MSTPPPRPLTPPPSKNAFKIKEHNIESLPEPPQTDYKKLARIRCFWIFGLVVIVLALSSALIYLEVARPVIAYNNESH